VSEARRLEKIGLNTQMRRIENSLLGFIRASTAVLLAIMFVVIILEVLFRYVLALPVFWTEELARYVMFYMVLIGSAAAVREDLHPALTFVIGGFGVRFRRWWRLSIDVMVLFVLVVVFWQGCVMAAEERIGRAAALRVSFFWIYLALPIGALLMMVQLVARNIFGKRTSDKEGASDSTAKEDEN
jgi:TRAP-type C4-dicarboxylate transport system permease small subunit